MAVIAPAGPPKPGRLAPVEGWLRERGYVPRLLPSCFGPPPLDFLAAPDAVRLADVHTAFADPSIDAVLALRGGSGCIRLLDGIDLGLLAASPKLLIGYSDLTVLHALRMNAGHPVAARADARQRLGPAGLAGRHRRAVRVPRTRLARGAMSSAGSPHRTRSATAAVRMAASSAATWQCSARCSARPTCPMWTARCCSSRTSARSPTASTAC